jgi:hypothetical protein
VIWRFLANYPPRMAAGLYNRRPSKLAFTSNEPGDDSGVNENRRAGQNGRESKQNYGGKKAAVDPVVAQAGQQFSFSVPVAKAGRIMQLS